MMNWTFEYYKLLENKKCVHIKLMQRAKDRWVNVQLPRENRYFLGFVIFLLFHLMIPTTALRSPELVQKVLKVISVVSKCI